MTSLQNKRIFIVEDSSLNRVVYKMILKRDGVELDFDRWGRDTLVYLNNFRPDIIIMDLMLGMGGSGYDVFAEIRKHPEFDSIPVVAISASEPVIAMPKCQEMGFSGFIAKPIEDQLLPDQLARIIEGEQIWYVGERYGGEVHADDKT
jgi:two-component system sensor histidine kinase/response regulator